MASMPDMIGQAGHRTMKRMEEVPYLYLTRTPCVLDFSELQSSKKKESKPTTEFVQPRLSTY